MLLSRYNTLRADRSVLRCNGDGELHIRSSEGRLVIGFYYIPFADYVHDRGESNTRVLLFVYPGSNWSTTRPVTQVSLSEALILVNPDHPQVAYTYSLRVDEEQGTATIKLCDLPEQGQSFISSREVMGITKRQWRDTATVLRSR